MPMKLLKIFRKFATATVMLKNCMLLLTVFLTAFTNTAFGAYLISTTLEQDGINKSIQEPLTGNVSVRVFLTDASIDGKWSIEILDKWEEYQPVAGIQPYEGYCVIDPEIIQTLKWYDLMMEYDTSLNRDLFILRLSFSSDGGQYESITLKWGLVPTRPVINDVTFTYVYDWEWDDIWPNGSFVFTVDSQDAERLEYHVTQSFQFGPPFFFTNCYAIDSPLPATIDYNADWGEFIQVSASNKYGWAHSDVICTTDYITDQDILNRIQEIAGVNSIDGEQNDPLISTDNSTLSFTEPVDVSIHDLTGKLIQSVTHQETVSLTDLQTGIYLISYRNLKKTFNLKFHKK